MKIIYVPFLLCVVSALTPPEEPKLETDCRVRVPENQNRKGYICSKEIGCYKVYTNPKTWNRARESCQEDGAYLAIINSKEEAEFIRKQLINRRNVISKDAHKNSEALIGIHDYFQPDDWVTVFGESLSDAGYDKWAVIHHIQRPIYTSKKHPEHCGAMTLDGTLNNVRCDLKFAYICEL